MENADFHWFVENYGKFQREYGDAYIVIKDKKVLGVYKTFGEGVRETSKSQEMGTFIVQECKKDKISYKFCYFYFDFT